MDGYAYQRPLGKIEDDPALRNLLIAVFDRRTKEDAVRFGLAYGRHLLDVTGFAPCVEVAAAFEAMQRWLDGTASYHEARNIAFKDLYRLAREDGDAVRLKFYRAMAQLACIPHVKFHALWAADFAVALVNAMHPGNAEEVRNERRTQVALLEASGKA